MAPMQTLIIAALLLSSSAEAGKKKKKDDDHANHFHPAEASADGVRVEASDAWARAGQFKVKLEYLAPADAWLLMPTGGASLDVGGTVVPGAVKGEKPIEPGDKKFVVHEILDESGRLHVDALQLMTAPARLVPTGGETAKGEPMPFPEQNRYTAGPFSCEIKGKPKRATDMLQVRLQCTYSGDKVGIIDPQAVQVQVPEGPAFANEAKAKAELLLPGDSKASNITNTSIQPGTHGIDLQFDSVKLLLAQAFTESEPVEVQLPAIALSLDPDTTAAKN